jgi:hypothetical protein
MRNMVKMLSDTGPPGRRMRRQICQPISSKSNTLQEERAFFTEEKKTDRLSL